MTGKPKIPNLRADGPEPEVLYSEFVSRHIDLSIEIRDLRERVEAIEERAQVVEYGTQDVIDPAATAGHLAALYFGKRREFGDWLASNAYGVDYAHETDPPITLHELAEAYMRVEGGEGDTLEDYVDTIRSSTGAYSKEATL